ncbi:MAG TPA: hypothetical protein PKD26_12470 [Pyrinomonadaceae bacterium]|nr:hypothetical protein [Pyrinomonadaceae bacterium]
MTGFIRFDRETVRSSTDEIEDKEEARMSEFDDEVRKAEKELEQSLVPIVPDVNDAKLDDEFLGDMKMQAQEYGQRLQDAAGKAKVYAEEKVAWAGDKLKELQNKDPKELIEDAKEFARQKPGQTILISAAIGLVIGFLLKRK